MSWWEFFIRSDAVSVPPSSGALGAAMMILALGLFPLLLAIAGDVVFSSWMLVWAVVALLFAACIPRRVVVSDHGVMLLLVFGRNRRLDVSRPSRWWGHLVLWKDITSIVRMKNHFRSIAIQERLGGHRLALRLRRHGTHVIHEGQPAYARFDRLIRQHIPEKIRDVSKAWWSGFQ